MNIANITVFPEEENNTAIVVEFCELRDGRVEVKFYREGNHTTTQYTELVGFKNPIKALKGIFSTIRMVREFHPDVEFFYSASGKRARVYKRFW